MKDFSKRLIKLGKVYLLYGQRIDCKCIVLLTKASQS